jgi:sugar phosphate isomerase/epimerase
MIFLTTIKERYFFTYRITNSIPVMKRRSFIKTTSAFAAAASLQPGLALARNRAYPVRLGANLFDSYGDPGEWIRLLEAEGYRTAYCPVGSDADEQEIRAYEDAARKHDVVISEVGAWSNTLSPDLEEAKKSIEKCVQGLQLADKIGARCCVNISGSRNKEHWAGPHRDNLSDEVFDMVVENTRKIIDEVKPTRSFFALEAMPWSFPDSADTYLKLLKAIDRPHFGVHLDPVNMIRSPREYFNNGAMIKDMFEKLGPHIKSCHAKDITLREDNYIPQMDEVRAGLGTLDYAMYLKQLSKLKDIPLMMEHLKTAEEYRLAAGHIRKVAQAKGISM